MDDGRRLIEGELSNTPSYRTLPYFSRLRRDFTTIFIVFSVLFMFLTPKTIVLALFMLFLELVAFFSF